MERLHHYKKEVLNIQSKHIMDVDVADRLFLQYVDTVTELSVARWNKLYALLAGLNQKVYHNYRIYENAQGLYFDVTEHKVYTTLPIQRQAAVFGPANKVHLQKELQQVNIKIRALKGVRSRILARIEEC